MVCHGVDRKPLHPPPKACGLATRVPGRKAVLVTASQPALTGTLWDEDLLGRIWVVFYSAHSELWFHPFTLMGPNHTKMTWNLMPFRSVSWVWHSCSVTQIFLSILSRAYAIPNKVIFKKYIISQNLLGAYGICITEVGWSWVPFLLSLPPNYFSYLDQLV